jgi:LacI family transcriptional regulator
MSGTSELSLERRKRRGGPVLRDLAALASVDISTISRALTEDPRVNPKRAQQIRELAERMGYRPKPLRSKRACSIGLLVTASRKEQFGADFLERIAWSVQRLLGQRRRHVNLECVARGGPVVVPALVQQNRVDGVIFAGHPSEELVRRIRELDMPAVAINDSMARLNISCVRSHPEPAIHQAILNLAARGHESFALLMTSLEYPTTQARHHSYTSALREIGIEPDSAWLISDLPDEIPGGRQGIRQLLQRGAMPTAILCENDWIAVGAIQELQQHNLRVPQDVSVMGHDDVWVCDQLEPTLTSIHRAEDQLVSQAIDLLEEQITGAATAPREVLVDGVMVWRQSTGTAPERLKR